MLDAAADGSFPPPDGATDVLPPDPSGWSAIVAFTGHAYVLADVEGAALARLGADGYGGASHPDVQRLVAGPDGEIGSIDAVLVGRGGPVGSSPVVSALARRHDLDDHPRVRRAREHRDDVAVHADDAGVVILGRGLAGRLEMAVELTDRAATAAAAGAGRRLIRAGLAAVEPGRPVWAQVSPGNARSLRAFLACGFVPICSEVLIRAGPDR